MIADELEVEWLVEQHGAIAVKAAYAAAVDAAVQRLAERDARRPGWQDTAEGWSE